MSTIQVTSREFRDKQAMLLDLADKGERVIIRRRNKKSYVLTPVDDDDFVLSPEAEKRIAKAREDIKAGRGTRCKTVEEAIAFLESL